MNRCNYKYSTGIPCQEYALARFCDKHKTSYQARNFNRLVVVGQYTVMLYNNEAVFIINGSKIIPMGQKEIIFLESKGINVNLEIRNIVFPPEEPEPSLDDTFMALQEVDLNKS